MYCTVLFSTHGISAGLPSNGADLAVGVRVLECLHQAKRLLHRPSHRQVVHRDLTQRALGVDDEQAPTHTHTHKYTHNDEQAPTHNHTRLSLQGHGDLTQRALGVDDEQAPTHTNIHTMMNRPLHTHTHSYNDEQAPSQTYTQ